MLENVIYTKRIRTVSEPKGYLAVSVTQEVNGFAVWVDDEESSDMKQWHKGVSTFVRDRAIDCGYELAFELMAKD